MHILSLVTDNNPSWINQRKGGEWPYKLFHDQSPRKYGTWPGSNSRPLELQSEWQTRICSQTRYRLRYAARSTINDFVHFFQMNNRKCCFQTKTAKIYAKFWNKIGAAILTVQAQHDCPLIISIQQMDEAIQGRHFSINDFDWSFISHKIQLAWQTCYSVI